MKILIDIGHPGHVHLFRPFTQIMQDKGHQILFTCRQKEFEIELLESEGFNYVSFGKKYSSILGKIVGLLVFNIKMLKTAIKFKPDIFLSAGSMYAAQVSYVLRKPHITFEDTGNMEQVNLYKPFTDVILTSDVFHHDLGKNQIEYSGFHELAYLHPNHFTPDRSIVKSLLVDPTKKTILFRFVSWNATHDVGQGGFLLSDKLNIVNKLKKKYNVFISSESSLPTELQKFRLKTKPEQIHDVMSYIDLFIGEGATMASECAMLGTPAIYVNTMEAGSIDDQEKSGLVFHFRKTEGVLEKAMDILLQSNSKEYFYSKYKKMLTKKIDVTAFLVWFIENYPKSKQIMKENPNYQNKFK
ncbi:MAG: DUF354 domain-containing protein [Flavobacteriaceae bacterium]